MGKYDVVIVENKSNKVSAVIGRNMRDTSAERRIMSGLCNLNKKDYHIRKIEHMVTRKDGDVV